MDVRIHSSISALDQGAWDALVGPAFPFAQYHFLHALETTDCLGDRTGWYPTYLTAHDGAALTGLLIAFAKTNGYGEYIFDFGWAEGARAAGLRYYPKLTAAIPFTPATGPKLFAANAEVRRALRTEFADLASRTHASSAHLLFVPEDEVPEWEAHGFLARASYQFHWVNPGYADFDHFLARLSSKRRREIRRERAQVAAAGLRLRRLTGAGLGAEHARTFAEFYASTVDKCGGLEYLTPEFFAAVFRTMADRTLLAWAETPAGSAVAGALFFFGRDALFGRQWGALAAYRALHFELCYYQGQEFAIERGFARFEAGAQGEHKIQRGFLPAPTHSVHRIEHPGLARGIARFIAAEREQVAAEIALLNERSPFAKVPTKETPDGLDPAASLRLF